MNLSCNKNLTKSSFSQFLFNLKIIQSEIFFSRRFKIIVQIRKAIVILAIAIFIRKSRLNLRFKKLFINIKCFSVRLEFSQFCLQVIGGNYFILLSFSIYCTLLFILC